MRKRNRHVSVWMNDGEYRHLKQQARAAGMGIDPFIRCLVADREIAPRPPDSYDDILRELSAIGNNVNQIARWANAKKGVQKVEIHYKMIGYVVLPHMSRAAEQSYLAAFGREETGRGA